MKVHVEVQKLQVFLHLFVWMLLFVVPTYFIYFDSRYDTSFLLLTYSQTGLYAIIFYLNYLVLVPGLFFHNRKWQYAVSFAGVLVLFTVVNKTIHHSIMENPGRPGPPREEMAAPSQRPPRPHGPEPGRNWPLYNFALTSFFISGFAFGLRFFEKGAEQEKQREEAVKEKLNTELAYLKNQISPHFFFNTLNNIYSLVETNPQEGQKVILQLSKMMRYLLYETDRGNTLLSQEIEFIRNYVELMRLRLSRKVSLLVSFPEQFPDVQVPPLLFLPFIENAFKHGVSYRDPSYIEVTMHVAPSLIRFECHNSVARMPEEGDSPGPGIGLENIRKRLSLLFPGTHDLEIRSTETSFHVILSLHLPQQSAS